MISIEKNKHVFICYRLKRSFGTDLVDSTRYILDNFPFILGVMIEPYTID